MAAAIKAAAMGCRAWAKAEGLVNCAQAEVDGITTTMHNAQSMVCVLDSGSPASSDATNFNAPPVVQTMSRVLGETSGEAMATLKDKTNHIRTKRVRVLACLI